MNNESTTNETQQHWPHGDRPAVSQALIQAYAFIHVSVSAVKLDFFFYWEIFSEQMTAQSRQQRKGTHFGHNNVVNQIFLNLK